MATEAAFDLPYGVGNESNEIFKVSYATFAEELQLQEILKESLIIASENATAGEASSSSSSSSSSSLPLPSPEAISSPSTGSSMEETDEAIKKSRCPVLSCYEKSRPEAEHFTTRKKTRGRRSSKRQHSQSNFNGRTSSSESHGAKMKSKKMSEDNQQLIWFKDRFEDERRRAKTLEGSVHNLSRNLQRKMEDIHIFKRRVQLLHEQNQEEMDSQEKFYEEKIRILEARVKELEKLQGTYASSVHTGEPAPEN